MFDAIDDAKERARRIINTTKTRCRCAQSEARKRNQMKCKTLREPSASRAETSDVTFLFAQI